jgi:hypothetical protein
VRGTPAQCQSGTRAHRKYGFDFKVQQVYEIMLKTKHMHEVPLAAYNPPPLTEKQRAKEAKRKAWMTRETRSSKRAHTKATAHVSRACVLFTVKFTDEDGDGPLTRLYKIRLHYCNTLSG